MQNFEDNILDYIENTLTESDKLAFEQELLQNINLQKKCKELQMVQKLLAEQRRNNMIKAAILNAYEEIEKEDTMSAVSPIKASYLPRIFSIAASIFLILGLGWWFSQEKENPYIQNHFVDYTVAAQMSSDITPFTALSNAYIENDDDMFRKTLQNVQPKDTAEFYALYAMKGTMEKRRKLYPDALSSFLTAENYAKTETEKIQTAVNQITLLLATQQNEKAKERLKSLLAQIPSAEKNITIEALQKDINRRKD